MNFPDTVREAEDLREALTDRLMDINSNLGLKNVTDSKGRRLTWREFSRKRDEWVKEKTEIERNLRKLKRHIFKLKEQDNVELADVDPDDKDQLIRRAYTLLKQVTEEFELELDQEEYAFLDVLGRKAGYR